MHHYSTDDECKETCIVQGQQDIRGGSITTTPRYRVQSTGKTSSRKKTHSSLEHYSSSPLPYTPTLFTTFPFRISLRHLIKTALCLLTTKKHALTQQHSQTTITTTKNFGRKTTTTYDNPKTFFTPCNPSLPTNNIITIQTINQTFDHVQQQQQQQQQRTPHPPTTPNLPPSFSATTNANAILASRAATTCSHAWRPLRRR